MKFSHGFCCWPVGFSWWKPFIALFVAVAGLTAGCRKEKPCDTAMLPGNGLCAVLYGKVDPPSARVFSLQARLPNGLDSAVLSWESSANGEFRVEGTVPAPGVYRISASGFPACDILLEGKPLGISAGHHSGSAWIFDGPGSAGQQLLASYLALKEATAGSTSSKDPVFILAVKELIKNAGQSYVALLALELFPIEADTAFANREFKRLSAQFPGAPPVANISEKLAGAGKSGLNVPGFELPLATGGTATLGHSGQGYQLLFFWASWCGACTAMIPRLDSLLSTQPGTRLDALAISLDSQRDAWLGATGNLPPPWQHLSDLQAWDGPVPKAFGLESLPALFLLDSTGKVVAGPHSPLAADTFLQALTGQ